MNAIDEFDYLEIVDNLEFDLVANYHDPDVIPRAVTTAASDLWTLQWGNRAEIRRQANGPWE